MEPLASLLRRELDKRGFCHDLFGQIEDHCAERLRENDSIDDLLFVNLFSLKWICFLIKERLENNPTATYHRRLEEALRPQLTHAIDNWEFDGQTTAAAIRRLIVTLYTIH